MPNNWLNYHSSDDEKRLLKTHNQQLKRSLTKRIKNQKDLETELRRIKREKTVHENQLNQEIEKLKAEAEKLRKERDMYRKMLFKENVGLNLFRLKIKLLKKTSHFQIKVKEEQGEDILGLAEHYLKIVLILSSEYF